MRKAHIAVFFVAPVVLALGGCGGGGQAADNQVNSAELNAADNMIIEGTVNDSTTVADGLSGSDGGMSAANNAVDANATTEAPATAEKPKPKPKPQPKPDRSETPRSSGGTTATPAETQDEN